MTNKSADKMRNFVIEKNIPLPQHNTRNNKYPWNEMEIGDSIVFANNTRGYSARRLAFHYAQRHPPIKFASRTTDGGMRIRIWRIA